MAVTINASTSAGLVTSADTSGNLDLQAGGVTKIAVTSSGVAVTGLSKASLPTGSVLQVVNATYSTLNNIISTSYVDTGLTATITPTSASSKILIIVTHCMELYKQASTESIFDIALLKSSSAISNLTVKAGATVASAGYYFMPYGGSFNYLDSPATTSATTYKTQVKSDGGSGVLVNRASTGTSTITLMEIAA